MRRSLAALIVLVISLPAYAHGGGFRDPPGPPPTPAATTADPAHAAPGDPCHRCAGLRGGAGEVPPDSCAAFDSPPPPPSPDPQREEWPLRHRVRGADGEPIEGALLWNGGVPLATSNGIGVFEADPGGEPGVLIVTATGHTPGMLRWDGEKLPSSKALQLAPGQALAGRLVHADGSAVSGARLRLVPERPRVPKTFAIVAAHAGWWLRLEGGTDALHFAGLAPGRYRLLVEVSGMPEECVARGLAPGDEPFAVVLPSRLSARERSVRVLLRDVDGEPVPEYMVEARTADGRRGRATAVEGVATVSVTGVGPLTIVASRQGGCTGPTPVAACAHDVPDEATELTLQLADAPATRDLVLAPPPAGAAGAFVRVIDRFRATATKTLWLGEKGLTVPVFDDAVLAVIYAHAQGYSQTTVGDSLFGITPGETVALPPPDLGFATIDGAIVRSDGTPVAGAVVRVRSSHDAPDTDLAITVRANARGRFSAPGVRGPVTLDVAAPGLSNAEGPYVVSRGETFVRIVVREELLR